jgi:ferredoxin
MGIAANTLRVIQGKLKQKGTDLHAGFVVKAPCSSLMKMNTLDKIVIAIDRQRKKLLTGETRLKEIAETVRRRATHKPETSSPPANLFGSLFHDYGINFFKTADKDFRVSQNCNGCGICVSVCPRENVAIENGKPVFSANCEFCHTCVQWCPQFAITHPNFDDKLHQYRNPHVRWKELVVLKKQNVS